MDLWGGHFIKYHARRRYARVYQLIPLHIYSIVCRVCRRVNLLTKQITPDDDHLADGLKNPTEDYTIAFTRRCRDTASSVAVSSMREHASKMRVLLLRLAATRFIHVPSGATTGFSR